MGNLFTKEKSNDNSCRPSRGSHEYPRQQERPTDPEKPLPEANPVPSAPDKPEEPKIWSGTAETLKTPENEKPSFAPETTKNKSASGSIKNISKSSSRQSVKLSTSTSKHSKIELEELSVKDLPLTGTLAQDSNFRNQKSPSEKSFSEKNPSIPQTPEKQQIPSVLGNLSQSSSRKSLRSSKPTTPLDAPNSPFRSPNGNKSQSPLVKSPSATSPLASPGSPASQKSGNLFGSLIKSPSATSPLVESKTESSAVTALQELVRSSSNTGSLGSASQSVTNELDSPLKEENAENNSVEKGELIDAPLEPASLETAAEPVLDEKIDDAPVDSPDEMQDMQQLPKSTSKSSLKSQNSATESQTQLISNSGSQKSIRSSKSQNFENLSKSSSKKSLRSSTSNQDFTKFSKSDSNKLLSVLAEGGTTQETSQNHLGNQELSMSKSSSKKSLRSQKSTSSSANRVISPTLSEEPQSILQDVPYSLSKSSSKKSIAGRSDASLKIDEILPEREDNIQVEFQPASGGNPFGEISKMNSVPPCEVYDGSAIKDRFYNLKIDKKGNFKCKIAKQPSQSIETEGGMTCEEVSIAESIPQSIVSETVPETEDTGSPKMSPEEEKTISPGFVGQISNSSSQKSLKQIDSSNFESQKDITDLL